MQAAKGTLATMPNVAPTLVGLDREELSQLAVDLALPQFRGRQLANHIYRRRTPDFRSMTDLPAGIRELLEERYKLNPLIVSRHERSSDAVQKLLVHSGDQQMYECVLLPYEDRVSCCLSSQVGCPMGCKFCATGMGGFERNLTPGEIVAQYLLLQSISERRIDRVVFMGMGEPLLNMDALLKSLRLLHDEVGLSYRHITVSTVGIVPGIRRLTATGLPIHMALSLHSPYDEVRDRLMPVNQRWPVAEVVGCMRDHQRETGRKVTFEYLLIDGLNDTIDQADALARLVRGIPCVVNLIPFNYVKNEEGFKRPSQEAVTRFRERLKRLGVNVTQRVERGHDIAAACGQLAGAHAGRFSRKSGVAELRLSS